MCPEWVSMQHTDLTENPSTKGRTSVPENCACWCSLSVCQVYGGWVASAAMFCASTSVRREPMHRWHWDPQCFPRAKNIWRFASTLFFQGTVLYSLQKWHSVHKQRLERTRVKPAACAIAIREHYSVSNKWQSCSLLYPRLCEKGVV